MNDTKNGIDQLPPLPDVQITHAVPKSKPLSWPSKILLWVGFPLTVAAISTRSYITTALLPVLALPTVWLWSRERAGDCRRRTDADTVIWAYVLSGTVGMAFVIMLQSILAYVITLLLFGSDAGKYMSEFLTSEGEIGDMDHQATRREMSRRWQYWIFLFIFAFVLAGLLEEGFKYCAIMGARKYGKISHDRDFVIVAIAAALGFATVENVAFVYATCKARESPQRLALTVLERVAVGAPLHSMGAALIAINVVARDIKHQSVTLIQVLQQPVVLHGTFDFVLFGVSAYNGHVGWVHPREGFTVYLALGIVVTFLSTVTVLLQRRLRQYGLTL